MSLFVLSGHPIAPHLSDRFCNKVMNTLGASGCGKITIVSNFIKHLEMYKSEIPFSIIYFDIKDVNFLI